MWVLAGAPPDDPEFIETKTVLFRPDAALLLSSDGLSDVLTSAEIGAILERYDGAPEKTAQSLVEAANAAGGNDNVSVVFVPGPEFLGSHSQRLIETRPRHAITRFRGDESGWRAAVRNLLWLLAGIAIGDCALVRSALVRHAAMGSTASSMGTSRRCGPAARADSGKSPRILMGFKKLSRRQRPAIRSKSLQGIISVLSN